VLVCFGDILVYGKSCKEHMVHLKQVLTRLQDHSLFADQKCSFSKTKVGYLGHITSKGVSMDLQKIEVILQYPLKTPKGLRGFLGLTGYYRRFICNYGHRARPPNDLLKKENFKWT